MKMKNKNRILDGKYVWHNDGMGGGEIVIDFKETEKSFCLTLLSNTCRYSPPHIDMLFSKSSSIRILKSKSSHAFFFSDFANDWFVLYPYRDGIPFLFEKYY